MEPAIKADKNVGSREFAANRTDPLFFPLLLPAINSNNSTIGQYGCVMAHNEPQRKAIDKR